MCLINMQHGIRLVYIWNEYEHTDQLYKLNMCAYLTVAVQKWATELTVTVTKQVDIKRVSAD